MELLSIDQFASVGRLLQDLLKVDSFICHNSRYCANLFFKALIIIILIFRASKVILFYG